MAKGAVERRAPGGCGAMCSTVVAASTGTLRLDAGESRQGSAPTAPQREVFREVGDVTPRCLCESIEPAVMPRVARVERARSDGCHGRLDWTRHHIRRPRMVNVRFHSLLDRWCSSLAKCFVE
jgi:hypothetical protein